MYQINLLKGIIFIIISEIMFVSMAALVKLASHSLSNETIVFFRNFFVIAILLPWLLHKGFTNMVKTQHFHLHLLRSISGLAAMYCFFYALAHIPLAEATVFSMTAPFFMPVIAFFWLNETIFAKVVLAIFVGFIGVVIILRPGFSTFSPITLIALSSGALAAVAKTSIRRMSFTEPGIRIVFYFALCGTAISIVPLIWHWQPISGYELIILFLLTAFGTVGQLLMTHAYKLASSSQLGAISYVSIVFSSIYGWLFWQEIVEYWFFIGAGLVMIAGLLISQTHQSERKTVITIGAQVGEATPQIEKI